MAAMAEAAESGTAVTKDITFKQTLTELKVVISSLQSKLLQSMRPGYLALWWDLQLIYQ